MNLGHDQDAARGMLHRNVEWARALERLHLRARLKAVIVPGLEELVDPGADPAVLIAMADRQARRLRDDLETTVPGGLPADRDSGIRGSVLEAREEEREWVRGHIHDTALQILEFIAGDGFGTGLTAAQIAHLAGGAGRDLSRWIEQSSPEGDADLLPQLELVTGEARAMDPGVELVVGDVGDAPSGEQAIAMAGAVREALTNARKHARCSRVVVHVDSDTEGRTAVTVTDDGVGIDLDRVTAASGLGVKGSIVGRMKRVGGRATLQNTPGGGTRVTLVTPTEESQS